MDGVSPMGGSVRCFSSSLVINMLHFCSLLRVKRGKTFLACVWECVVWRIWKARNAIIFRDEQGDREKMVDDIKSYLWSWLSCQQPGLWRGRFGEWRIDPKALIELC